MIYVYIKKELAKFETDIRDLCLAFFTLQKIKYIIGDEEVSSMVKDNELCEPNYIIKDYYTGSLTGDRLTIKSEVKRQLYKYLSKLTGKTLLWGTLTGIRPVNIATNLKKNLNLGTGYIIGEKGTLYNHLNLGKFGDGVYYW